MPRSAIERVRSGGWRRRELSDVVIVGIVALVADIVTTAHILLSPGYYEANPVLVALADVHVALPLAYMAVYGAIVLLLAAHSLGWLSRVAGAIAVVHLAFPLNNLVLFATDEALFDHLGVGVDLAVTLLVPAAGIAVGLLLEYRDYGLPWREVAVGLVAASLFLAPDVVGL